MGAKAQKPPSGKGKAGEDDKEDALQAVILADTFETRFAPFTLERPRCLLPLANTPLIEYTLEFLANAGVQDVFLYGGSHVDQVEMYLNASKWKSSASPFKKFVFLRTAATSVGDVMRDLDQKHFITGDFVSVSGDIVCNFAIEDAIKMHKLRRQKDKNAIMTMLLRERAGAHPANADSIIPTFVIDPTKDRCLHYEEARHVRTLHANVDPEMLSESEIDIRQDLVDCRIDICTPDVLSLWSDNFDNQTPRKDFLYGVLKDYELNGKTIHTHIIKDRYAARVGNLPLYDSISSDITTRSAFPICPDNNLFSDQNYKKSRNGVYQEDDLMLARSCHIGSGSIIGRGTSIGAGSIISNSVIGRNCQIGKNVSIAGAYLWNDVTIGNDVKVLKAIIANESFVGDRSTIAEGALLSFGVHLAVGTVVRSGAKITRAAPSGRKRSTSDAAVVGEGGQGYAYSDDEDEEDMTIAPGLVYKSPDFGGSTSSLSSSASEGSDAGSSYVGSRSESFATTMSDEDGIVDRFHHEAVLNLFERMQTKTAASDIRLELTNLRLSYNASEHQVRKAVAVAMMKHIQNSVDSGAATAADASRATLSDYRSLVQRGQDQEPVADQVDFLSQAQRDLIHRSDGDKILLFVAKDLYDLEIMGEEAFTQWWGEAGSTSDEGMRKVREATKPFIDWLANAESESESEEGE